MQKYSERQGKGKIERVGMGRAQGRVDEGDE